MSPLRWLVLIVFHFHILSVSPATADMNTEDFIEYIDGSKESEGIALFYIVSAYSAFQVANVKLANLGRELLFCVDNSARLTERELAFLVALEIEAANLPLGSDVSVAIVLLDLLSGLFPCD